MTMTRRSLLAPMTAMPLLSLELPPALAQGARLELTPECSGAAHRTIANPEGPYFRPSSPLKRDLAADIGRGERIVLGGFVLDEGCRPVPGALVELWHADDNGRYDNQGFKLRGHQFTDERGMWWFSTIVPAAYWARTRHYHFKVQRPNDRVLTTQLYFPDEPQNRRDNEFDTRLLMRIARTGDEPFGRFDFVI